MCPIGGTSRIREYTDPPLLDDVTLGTSFIFFNFSLIPSYFLIFCHISFIFLHILSQFFIFPSYFFHVFIFLHIFFMVADISFIFSSYFFIFVGLQKIPSFLPGSGIYKNLRGRYVFSPFIKYLIKMAGDVHKL